MNLYLYYLYYLYLYYSDDFLHYSKCNYIIYPGSGFFEPYKLYKGLSKYQQNLVNYRNKYCNTYIIIPDGEDKLSINFKGNGQEPSSSGTNSSNRGTI